MPLCTHCSSSELQSLAYGSLKKSLSILFLRYCYNHYNVLWVFIFICSSSIPKRVLWSYHFEFMKSCSSFQWQLLYWVIPSSENLVSGILDDIWFNLCYDEILLSFLSFHNEKVWVSYEFPLPSLDFDVYLLVCIIALFDTLIPNELDLFQFMFLVNMLMNTIHVWNL